MNAKKIHNIKRCPFQRLINQKQFTFNKIKFHYEMLKSTPNKIKDEN